jgi:hypothetical protein
MERRSFPDFLKSLNNHVDLKEWSEVGGVFNIVMNLFKDFNPDFILDVGCGKRPTFAILMVLNYKITTYAIDPNLGTEYLTSNLRYLYYFKNTLETFSKESVNSNIQNSKVLIVCNHSHVKSKEISEFINSLKKDWVYITVPCCYDNKLPNQKSISIIDKHIHSPKNEIFIYSNNTNYLCNIL